MDTNVCLLISAVVVTDEYPADCAKCDGTGDHDR